MAPPANICLQQQFPMGNKNTKNAGQFECGTGNGHMLEEEKNVENDYDSELIDDILARHGGPADEHDRLKLLELARLESERDICIFQGAIEYLRQQLADSSAGSCCAVCDRVFQQPSDYENCVKQLQIKVDDTVLCRDESKVVNIHSACSKALNHKVEDISESQSRVTFNLRTGALTELRNQKIESLSDLRCFACLRRFEAEELSSYLAKVDRKAASMQASIHVHHN